MLVQKEKSITTKNSGDLSICQQVLDPAVKDGVAGVGIAESPSKAELNFKFKAELMQKQILPQQFKAISTTTKDSLRSAKVNENDDVEEFFAQATKEVVKEIPLSGVKKNWHFQIKDGTLYISYGA